MLNALHSEYLTWSLFSSYFNGIDRKDLVLLQAKLAQHLVAAQDSVRFYALCADCVRRVETVGGPPPADQVLFIV